MVKIFNFSVGCHMQFFAFFLDFHHYLLLWICGRGPKHLMLTHNSYLELCLSLVQVFAKKNPTNVILYHFFIFVTVSLWHGYGYLLCEKTALIKLILAVFIYCTVQELRVVKAQSVRVHMVILMWDSFPYSKTLLNRCITSPTSLILSTS